MAEAIAPGRCAICHVGPAVRVDHDTGGKRGLVPFGCHTGLGNVTDDMKRLLGAVDDLEGYVVVGPIECTDGEGAA